MNPTKAQRKALHNLTAALTGTNASPFKITRMEEQYAPLLALGEQDLIEELRNHGDIAQCEVCDFWCEVEELDEQDMCHDCSSTSEGEDNGETEDT